MRINELVRAIVVPAIGACDYDPDAINKGITAYARDYGFEELSAKFSESVIQKVIRSNLSQVLNMRAESIVLFFSNYQIIEKVRIVNNQSLALADRVRTGDKVSPDEIQTLETKFENCMVEVCGIEGLREFLDIQISDIILNIEFAKGATMRYSHRLCSVEGDPK
jgi:hypothetical protein